jgi:hypothetical protein
MKKQRVGVKGGTENYVEFCPDRNLPVRLVATYLPVSSYTPRYLPEENEDTWP